MSELKILGLMCITWLGIFIAAPIWIPAALAGVALAVIMKSELGLVLAIGVLASSLGARAERLHIPLDPQQFDGVATLVTDPEPARFGWRAEARLNDGSRVRLSASGPPAWALADGTAGEQWHVAGRIRPADLEPWLMSRHILGFLSVTEARRARAPHWVQQPSEQLRSSVSDGAALLPRQHRSLYMGLVIGDDRFQEAAQKARFRAAGLTHLLAVSGQNVAFALAVARPLLLRLPLRTRIVATMLLLAVFAVATRLEPSVVRATTTAAIAVAAAGHGARTAGTHALALAVTLLLLVDPLLSRSVGFQLSVGASLGILLLSLSISRRLRGPGPLREALAITLAAQVGVAPLLLATFGPISMVTIPANVLAGWAAGAVMTWGLSVGIVAAWLPAPLAHLVQAPVAWLVWWIDAVAAWSARLPAPIVDGRVLALLAAGAILVWLLSPRSIVRLPVVAALAASLVLAVAHPPTSSVRFPGGGDWFPATADTPSVLVLRAGADDRLIDAVVRQRVTGVDIVILERGHRPAAALAQQLRQVVEVGVILAPPQHRVVGARRLLEPLTIDVGAAGELRVDPGTDQLAVS